MLMREIMDLINPDKMTIHTMRRIIDHIERSSPNDPVVYDTDPQDIVDHYGREYEDELDAARLEKIMAQIRRLDTQSYCDIAATLGDES